MSDFEDYEPEDAWDAGDGPFEHIHNLIERLQLLADHLQIPADPIDETRDNESILDEVERRVLLAERIHLFSEHDVKRIRLLVVDIFFIRQQLS